MDDSFKFEDIVFLQNSEADEVLNIIEENGEEAGLQYLLQWDQGGGEGELRLIHPAGLRDNSFENEHFVMSYNSKIGYAGLCRKLF